MRCRVVVSFTLKEAEMLSRAAGNMTDSPDALDAWFRGADRGAVLRAHQKLFDTIIQARIKAARRSK